MIFYKDAFQLFHDVLLKDFQDREFEDLPDIKHSRLSTKLWKLKIDGEKKLRSLRIAGRISSNANIFFEILHRKEHPKKVDKIVICGLEYIGITLPQQFDAEIISDKEHVQILFQVFLESQGKKGNALLKKYPDLKVFDYTIKKDIENEIPEKKEEQKTDTSFNKNFNIGIKMDTLIPKPKKLFFPRENQNHNNSLKDAIMEQFQKKEDTQKSFNLELKGITVHELISKFFENISKGDFFTALSDFGNFKPKVELAYELCRGFVWTKQLSKIIHVKTSFSKEKLELNNRDIYDCVIYFEEYIDTVRACSILGLKHTPKNIEQLYKLTEAMQTNSLSMQNFNFMDEKDKVKLFDVWDKQPINLFNSKKIIARFEKLTKFKRIYNFILSKPRSNGSLKYPDSTSYRIENIKTLALIEDFTLSDVSSI